MKREVVITGLGVLSAAGEGVTPLWDAWISGRSAIEDLSFDGWNPTGAYLKDFNPERYIANRKSIKVMARDIQMAVGAAKLAMEDSKINLSELDHDKAGITVGAGVLSHELDELASSVKSSYDEKGDLSLERFGEEGLHALFPLWLLKYLPNMPACHISILFDLRGPSNTITTGASSGLQAVEEACRIIERGTANMMLAGGAESKINPVGYSQYASLKSLSEKNGQKDPKKLYRPFDHKAQGLVPGEGACFLVFEELEHARKRGATIYAKVAGYGSSSSDGQSHAIRAAFQKSGLTAKDISYIQASGIGIAADDRQEMKALTENFGSHSKETWVSASKPVTGFTGFVSGALDLLIAVKALNAQQIGPIQNFEQAAIPFDFKVVKQNAVSVPLQRALVTSFGLGGPSSSVIIETFKG